MKKKMCFYQKLHKALNSNKGAATVLALCVIMVLTTLGVVALMSSAVNVGMSGKTYRWTEDFYRLDAQASKYEKMIDEELMQAEKDARDYVMNRMDRLKPHELIGDYADVNIYNMENSGAQTFFNNFYRIVWTYYDGTDEYEYTVDDYLNCPTGDLEVISRWYKEWRDDHPDPSELPPSTIDDRIEAYKSDISVYTSELFDRVYFHLLAVRLEKLMGSPLFAVNHPGDMVLERKGGLSPAEYGVVYSTPENYSTFKYKNFAGIVPIGNPRDPLEVNNIKDKWDDIEPEDGDIGILLRVNQDSLDAPAHPLDDLKKVHVYISVIKPEYETVLKHIYTPIKGNPIWANALSVEGSIIFSNGSHATINGDVYASSADGISVMSNAKANISGNVYTSGNLQVKGDNGELNVYRNAYTYDAKTKIYGTNLFFENYFKDSADSLERSFGNDLTTYTTTGPDGAMPFVFLDGEDRGNVYCNDLIVGVEGAPISGASLKVAGNIWTRDDIQMEALGSTIEIGSGDTYYIGLNPFSATVNPNESSSVINNYPYDDTGAASSKIVINSNFYIPGVAFYEFATGPSSAMYGGKAYYSSLESIASRNSQPSSLLNAYIYRSDLGGASQTFTNGSDEFELFAPSEALKRRTALRDYISSVGGIFTNVKTDKISVDGYVAETALLHHGSTTSPATLYSNNPVDVGGISLPHSTDNFGRFSYFTIGSHHFLMDIFDTKTKKLGTGKPDGGFEHFIDDSVLPSLGINELINVTATGILDLQTYNEGIVYCDGNLVIRDSDLNSGSNSFRGVIICTGDVIIQGGDATRNIKIEYDESVIKRKLKYSEGVRKFFEKGTMGEKVEDFVEYSTSSGQKRTPKRYKLKEWREVTAS